MVEYWFKCEAPFLLLLVTGFLSWVWAHDSGLTSVPISLAAIICWEMRMCPSSYQSPAWYFSTRVTGNGSSSPVPIWENLNLKLIRAILPTEWILNKEWIETETGRAKGQRDRTLTTLFKALDPDNIWNSCMYPGLLSCKRKYIYFFAEAQD